MVTKLTPQSAQAVTNPAPIRDVSGTSPFFVSEPREPFSDKTLRQVQEDLIISDAFLLLSLEFAALRGLLNGIAVSPGLSDRARNVRDRVIRFSKTFDRDLSATTRGIVNGLTVQALEFAALRDALDALDLENVVTAPNPLPADEFILGLDGVRQVYGSGITLGDLDQVESHIPLLTLDEANEVTFYE